MESHKGRSESQLPSSATKAAPIPSCRKKKSEDSSFIADLRDHFDEFIHASVDEHKSCFKKTIEKMFGMSKIVAERSSALNEVESSLPLQTVTE